MCSAVARSVQLCFGKSACCGPVGFAEVGGEGVRADLLDFERYGPRGERAHIVGDRHGHGGGGVPLYVIAVAQGVVAPAEVSTGFFCAAQAVVPQIGGVGVDKAVLKDDALRSFVEEAEREHFKGASSEPRLERPRRSYFWALCFVRALCMLASSAWAGVVREVHSRVLKPSVLKPGSTVKTSGAVLPMRQQVRSKVLRTLETVSKCEDRMNWTGPLRVCMVTTRGRMPYRKEMP